ncbi:cobalt ECF transporter T component CbiQ, partial [Mycobacterium sp. ITM-2017-0098]
MARISRGDSPRMMHQIGATAKSVGALFLRSYERGERVYLAMLPREATPPSIAAAAAVTIAMSAWVLR